VLPADPPLFHDPEGLDVRMRWPEPVGVVETPALA